MSNLYKCPKARVLVADPPWPTGSLSVSGFKTKKEHYEKLTIEQIKDFPLPPLVDDAWLFMWRLQYMVPEALEVMQAWGFEHKSELVWVKRTVHGKLHFGPGYYLRGSHEVCLIGRRRCKGPTPRKAKNIRTVLEARTGRHSQKPDKFYGTVEEFSDGPYVELFARQQRFGWHTFGNEIPNLVPGNK